MRPKKCRQSSRGRLFLLALLTISVRLSVEETSDIGSDYPQQEERNNLYILALAPYPDRSYNVGWDGGPGLIPAARLAVEQINNRTDLLPDYNLRLIEEDSGCFIASKTLVSYTRILYRERNVVAAIGPGCSPTAVELGKLSSSERIPFVQLTIATSPDLESRTAFPYTFATISASNQFAHALLSLMEEYEWNSISVVFEGNSVFHKTVVVSLEEEIKRSNKSISSFAMFETYFPLEQIIQTRTTIVVVLGTRALARQLLCMALKNERRLTFPIYQWVFIARTFSDFIEDDYCTLSEYGEALTNAIFLEYSLETTDRVNHTISGLNYSEYTQALLPKISEHETETGLDITNDYIHGLEYATVYYDAVWSLALSLDNISKTSNVDLSNYRPGRNRTIPDMIAESLYALEFKGASGGISFDRSTGRASTVITFSQVKGNQSLSFGFYDRNRIFQNFENSTSIDDNFKEIFGVVRAELGAVIILVVVVQLIVTIFFHAFTFVYRNEKSIKGSSPQLSQFIFFSCYFVILDGVLYCMSGVVPIKNETLGGFICNLHNWLSISACIIMATVCVKTWRLYRIFIHYMRPGGAALSDPVLAVIILVIQIPLVVANIIVSVVSPSEWVITESTSTGANGEPILTVEASCSGPWHISLLLGPYIFLLLCALLLTLVNGKKITKMYRTTKSTSALVYIHTMVFPTLFAIIIIAEYQNWSFYVVYLINCFGPIFFVFTCIIFLMVPPTIPVIRASLVQLQKFSFFSSTLA